MIAYFMVCLKKVIFYLSDPNKLGYLGCLRSNALIKVDKNCLMSFIFKSKIDLKGLMEMVFLGFALFLQKVR